MSQHGGSWRGLYVVVCLSARSLLRRIMSIYRLCLVYGNIGLYLAVLWRLLRALLRALPCRALATLKGTLKGSTLPCSGDSSTAVSPTRRPFRLGSCMPWSKSASCGTLTLTLGHIDTNYAHTNVTQVPTGTGCTLPLLPLQIFLND